MSQKIFKRYYEKIKSSENINLAGICTHFPVADIEKEPTDISIKLFKELISNIDTSDLLIPVDNSGSTFYNFDPIFNLSRIGLAVYGCNITPVEVDHEIKTDNGDQKQEYLIFSTEKRRSCFLWESFNT